MLKFPTDRTVNAQLAAIKTFLSEWYDTKVSKNYNYVNILPQGDVPLVLLKFYNLIENINNPIFVQNDLTTKEDAYSVWCGSKEPNALDFIEKYIDNAWEYVNIQEGTL